MRTRMFLGLILHLVLVGCSGATSRAQDSRRVLSTENRAAEDAYRQAEEALERSEWTIARARFLAFVASFPSDPLVPAAHLELAKLYLSSGALESAGHSLEVARAARHPELLERARFYGAVLLHLQGEHQRARAELLPFVGRTALPAETELLHRTLAAIAQSLAERVEAARHLDGLVTQAAHPETREQARRELQALVSQMTDEEVLAGIRQLDSGGHAWPLLAARAIRIHFTAGRMQEIRSIAQTLQERRTALDEELADIVLRAERDVRADPHVIGAILPMTGRNAAIGLSVMRGMTLASGAQPDGPSRPDTNRIVFRDDASSPSQAGALVVDLATVHQAIAIVGSVETSTSQTVRDRATELAVPVVQLSAQQAGSSTTSSAATSGLFFYAGPSLVIQTRALLNAAPRAVRQIGVVRMDAPYSEQCVETLRNEAASRRYDLSLDATFAPANVRAFTDQVRQASFDALFFCVDWRTLALVAPVLAQTGTWPNTKTYLVPQAGFHRDLARLGGRYLSEALFAIAFNEVVDEPARRAFIEGYTAQFGEAPGLYAAIGFDVYNLIDLARSFAARHGATTGVTRDSVRSALTEVRNETAVTNLRALDIDSQVRGMSIVTVRNGTWQNAAPSSQE